MLKTKLIVEGMAFSIESEFVENESGNKNKSELAREYSTSDGNVRGWIKKYNHKGGKKGYHYDNASMESFNAILKKSKCKYVCNI